MPYWDVVMRSFRISWNHKYLWLIALFSGEGGGGFSFNYSQPSTGRGASPNFATIQQQVTTWVADHVALIVLLAILWLLLVIVFFILAAVCEGATVRASAEHDAERQFGLRWAWRSGVTTMWVIVRFRLLLLAIVFVPLFLIGAVAFASGTAAFLPFVILGVVILLPVALVVQGFVAAQSSTYWTLAFRRLDLEQAPAYSYPYQPTPQPPQITS